MKYLFWITISLIISANIFSQDLEFIPSDRIISNTELKNYQKNHPAYSYIPPNETSPSYLKPVLENLNEGVYISVGTERGFIAASMSGASHLLLVDIDPNVVLYNRAKIGLIAISKSRKDLRYLILKAGHNEWIQRINSYNGHLTYGVKEAVVDPYVFKLFVQHARVGLYSPNMMILLGIYFPGFEFYGANYHFNEQQYNKIKSVVTLGNASAHFVNITDEGLLYSVASKIKTNGSKLAALDISNAWQGSNLVYYQGSKDLFHNLNTNKKTALSDYNAETFENILRIFKEVSDSKSSIIFSQTSAYKNKSFFYVVFTVDHLLNDRRDCSKIPNLIYSYSSLNKKLVINPILPDKAPSMMDNILAGNINKENLKEAIQYVKEKIAENRISSALYVLSSIQSFLYSSNALVNEWDEFNSLKTQIENSPQYPDVTFGMGDSDIDKFLEAKKYLNTLGITTIPETNLIDLLTNCTAVLVSRININDHLKEEDLNFLNKALLPFMESRIELMIQELKFYDGNANKLESKLISYSLSTISLMELSISHYAGKEREDLVFKQKEIIKETRESIKDHAKFDLDIKEIKEGRRESRVDAIKGIKL